MIINKKDLSGSPDLSAEGGFYTWFNPVQPGSIIIYTLFKTVQDTLLRYYVLFKIIQDTDLWLRAGKCS